jgi:DnaJ-class molecular chaperone
MEMTMSKEVECPECYGTGAEYVMRAVRLGEKIAPPKPCSRCGGSGRIKDSPDGSPNAVHRAETR